MHTKMTQYDSLYNKDFSADPVDIFIDQINNTALVTNQQNLQQPRSIHHREPYS